MSVSVERVQQRAWARITNLRGSLCLKRASGSLHRAGITGQARRSDAGNLSGGCLPIAGLDATAHVLRGRS